MARRIGFKDEETLGAGSPGMAEDGLDPIVDAFHATVLMPSFYKARMPWVWPKTSCPLAASGACPLPAPRHTCFSQTGL